MDYTTKDSGERQSFDSGMVRDTQNGKARFDLVDWPMIKRWAELMERGAKKYGEHNWKKAAGESELERFKASALRHCIQWYLGETDEDHGAATFFNISGAEMVKAKLLAPESLKCCGDCAAAGPCECSPEQCGGGW